MQGTRIAKYFLVALGYLNLSISSDAWAGTTPSPLLPPGKPLVKLPGFAPILKQTEKAVVRIDDSNTRYIGGKTISNPFPRNSPFHDFFKPFEGYQEPAKQHMEVLGSGFIISSNGYIITAGHVVRGMHHIVVTLYNHSAYSAKVVGLSVQYDTALLKIHADYLPTVKLGNAHDLKVGQWLLAVGMPFGFYYTVTQGVISALNRSIPHDDPYIPFIQSDVPINPGNSGGPVFNLAGQVVGFNDQIYTHDSGYMGLAFSIPINTAMRAVDAFMEHRKLHFGWLGVIIQNVSPALAKAFHLREPVGALISYVEPNDAAARAGLQPGEVIVTYNGQAIYQVGQLPPLVGETPVDSTVPIGILKDGHPATVEVRIGAMPKSMRYTSRIKTISIRRLAIAVAPITQKEQKQLGIRYGVIIRSIYPGPLATIGLTPGMAIQRIGHHKVTSPEQLEHMVHSLPNHVPLPMLVREHKQSIYLVIKLTR